MWASEWPSSRRSTTTSRSGSPSRAIAATAPEAAPWVPTGPAVPAGRAGTATQGDPRRWASASRAMAISHAPTSASPTAVAGSQPRAAWKTWPVSASASAWSPVQASR